MSDYPHTYPPATETNWRWSCRCGAVPIVDVAHTAPAPWGADCPAAMREEIAALRGQVEALKDGAGSLHKAYARGQEEERVAVVAFLHGWRDDPMGEFTRRQVSLVAMDIKNGAHRA